jgi:hypothetical protein
MYKQHCRRHQYMTAFACRNLGGNMFEGLLPAGWAAGMDNLRVVNLTDNSLSGWGGGQLMLYFRTCVFVQCALSIGCVTDHCNDSGIQGAHACPPCRAVAGSLPGGWSNMTRLQAL